MISIVTIIQVVILVLGNAVVHGFNPVKDSLMVGLDKAKDASLLSKLNQNQSFEGLLNITEECLQRTYNYCVYYRMVYFRVCEDTLEGNFTFSQFCNSLQLPQTELAQIKTEQIRNRLFGPGIESEQLWLARRSCEDIDNYYKAKTAKKIRNIIESDAYPRYSEWFIHTTPFTVPVACGYTKEAYYGRRTMPSAADCMTASSKWGLYATFIVDGVLIVSILFANIIVLMVSIKTKVYCTTNGQLRMSLAIADLLTAVVVCGSIFTTYTIYFGPHRFYEPGQAVSFTDYHTQSYIDGVGVVTILAFAASAFNLVALTFDRFFAVFRPLFYKLHYRRIRCCNYYVLFFIWILSLTIALCPTFVPTLSYNHTTLGVIISPNFYLAYIIFLGGSLLCIWILNLWMLGSLKKSNSIFSLQVHDTQFSRKSTMNSTCLSTLDSRRNTPHSSYGNIRKGYIVISSDKRSMDLKLASTVRLIVVAFSIPVISVILVMIAGLSNTLEPSSKEFDPTAKAVWNSFAYLSSRFLFANSFVNCIIYSYKSRSFKSAAKLMLTFGRGDRSKDALSPKKMTENKSNFTNCLDDRNDL